MSKKYKLIRALSLFTGLIWTIVAWFSLSNQHIAIGCASIALACVYICSTILYYKRGLSDNSKI